jgi:PfaD family protein
VEKSTSNASSARWIGNDKELRTGVTAFKEAVANVGRPLFVVGSSDAPAVTHNGTMLWASAPDIESQGKPLLGFAPPVQPMNLGDPLFKRDLNIRYAYVIGAMANGITSVEMVRAAGEAGMIGFFGAGGLSLGQIESAIERLTSQRDGVPFGVNLIHSPNDPQLEEAVVDLYLRKEIRLVSASAYLGLTLPLVYYRIKGIHQAQDGRIVCPNHIVAKVSRIEVASKFFAPPPEKFLKTLVEQGRITEREAHLAERIPLAQDMTAEADSGGHTDNRPALTMLPTFMALRDEAMQRYQFPSQLRVGLGGGIATPDSAAAAFAMGAAYVLTGSINQACVEADTSHAVREMLAQAQQADVTMAPSADMFEMGVKVQVLKRGTMFAMRAARLYELYRTYDRYEQIPETVRTTVEKDFLQASFEEAWGQTRQFFEQRDRTQIDRAERDPKHKMALVFRSYLGRASLWAKSGDPARRIDYQIWCGPAMGAFNAWAKGSILEPPQNRHVATIGINLLYGAAGLMRCNWLRSQGIIVPSQAAVFRPMEPADIQRRTSC